MGLIKFGYTIDMNALQNPATSESFFIGYDLDGVLKQLDYQGNLTPISGVGGPQGPPGPVGPAGLTWSGSWVATQSYYQNYVVGYASASWWCILDILGATSNDGPDLDTTHWTLLAAQGSPGSQGGTGSQGSQGPPGDIGINWRGNWQPNYYDPRDAVYFGGSSYICILSPSIGTETIDPSINTAFWELIALKGTDGLTGVRGATGSTLQNIFYNLGGTVSATNSTTDIYRTGSLNIGTGTASNSRFLVSSSTGTNSLIVGENGAVSINSSQSIGGSKLFIQSNTASTTIGSNVMLDLYNGQSTGTPNQVSELAFSADTAGNDPYNNRHRYAIISGYATTWNNSETGGGIKFSTRELTSSTLTEKMIITPGGNIGIGTASPSTKLHIYGTQSGAFRLEDGTQGPGKVLTSDATGVASWTPLSSIGISGSASYIPMFTGTSSLGDSILYIEPVEGRTLIINRGRNLLSSISYLSVQRGQSQVDITLGNGDAIDLAQTSSIISDNSNGFRVESKGPLLLSTGTSYSEKVRISTNGNVGIGTASPSTKLHIFATQSGAFRLVDGTQGSGYVLTSDATGVASWTSSLTGLSLLGNSEVISASVSATASLVVYDYSLSSIFYHATASTNFTANFTNLPTTNNRVLSATIVISQGATAYIPNIVQITGVTQSIKWAGGTQSGTANSLDLISFNFIRTGNVWTSVIGQIAPFS